MISVDIVLPFYNGSKFIRDQIDSIINDSIPNISYRLIIINDASTPEESKIIESLLQDNSLYVVNEVNLGVIKSIEKGLKLSTAPYVLLCDQDDVWLPQKIQKSVTLMKSIEADGPALVFTDLIISGPQLELLEPSMMKHYNYCFDSINPSILFQNIVTGCTSILNRKLIKFALPFPDEIPMHDHWLASCAVFSGKVELLKEPTVLYRQHGSNQVGAPSANVFPKIIQSGKTIARFQNQLNLKTKMATALALRLAEHGKNYESGYVEKVARAFEDKNAIYLIKSRVIDGKFIRVFGVALLMIILKFKKCFLN